MKHLKEIKDWEELRNQVVCGDCLEGMKLIPDKSIDLILTSPPYDNLRDYKGYSFDFEATAKEIKRILKDGGVCVWVVGDQTIKGSETGTSFKQALRFKEIGMNLHDTMIYQKNSYPFPPSNRYFGVFEYMFVFSNGVPSTTNLIKVPNIKQVKNNNSSTSRQADGTVKKFKYKTGKATRIKENVWIYETGYNKSSTYNPSHPATFPEKLALNHIESWSNRGYIVLDPFMGSWTTARACKDLGRDFIGFELSEDYCEIGEKRLAQQVMF